MSKEDKETNIEVLKEAFKDIHEEIDEKVKHSHEQAKKRVKEEKDQQFAMDRKYSKDLGMKESTFPDI